MDFTTPVNIPTDRTIDYNSIILMLGSCFAENIGRRLDENRFNICINPTGILYNPISIAVILNRLICNNGFSEQNLFSHNGLWSSFFHHGSFSRTDKMEALSIMNEAFEKGCNQLRDASHIIITFGSAAVYEHNGAVVCNCHKLPADQFNERILSVNEICEAYDKLIPSLLSINPEIKIIFTISPVRYLGDGAHNGQINKSTLMLSTDYICQKYKNASYFPSYEIMMDELRDYRFYAADMIHPSQIAVDYIYQRFYETNFTKEAISTASEIDSINKSLAHKPLHPDSESYFTFKKKLSQQIAAIANKYPNIKF